jgi:hypothetical protein
MNNPFRYFNSSPEVIRLVVLMYVRYPLSLRNVEDLLAERGIDISHETVRFWWNRFGPIFADEIRKRRVATALQDSSNLGVILHVPGAHSYVLRTRAVALELTGCSGDIGYPGLGGSYVTPRSNRPTTRSKAIQLALSRCRRPAQDRETSWLHAATPTASRHVAKAGARSSRFELAEMRWRQVLNVL